MKILTRNLWESCRNNINETVYARFTNVTKSKYIPDLRESYEAQEMMRQTVRLTVNEIMEEEANKPKFNIYPDNIKVDYALSGIGELKGVSQGEIQNWIWHELKNRLNAEDGVLSNF